MCHLGVNQLITVYHFSLLCEMDESTSRLTKTSDEEKTLQTQQQLDLELPQILAGESDSELNSEYTINSRLTLN